MKEPEADTSERLPTDAEIRGADPSGDAEFAVRHFYGKTAEEAAALFGAGGVSSLTYTEDLDWMAPAGLRYYLRSAVLYARSDRSSGDSSFLDGFAGALGRRLEREPHELQPCAQMLAEVCTYIEQNFNRYDADPEIYGDLKGRYSRLAADFAGLAAQDGRCCDA